MFQVVCHKKKLAPGVAQNSGGKGDSPAFAITSLTSSTPGMGRDIDKTATICVPLV